MGIIPEKGGEAEQGVEAVSWDEVVTCPYAGCCKRMPISSFVHHTVTVHVQDLVLGHTCDQDAESSCLSCDLMVLWRVLYGPAAEKRRRLTSRTVNHGKRPLSSESSDSDSRQQSDALIRKKKKRSKRMPVEERHRVRRVGDVFLPCGPFEALASRKKNRSIDGSFMSLVGFTGKKRNAFQRCASQKEARQKAKAASGGKEPMHHDKPHDVGQDPHFHPSGHEWLLFWYEGEQILVNLHYTYSLEQLHDQIVTSKDDPQI